MRRQNSFRDVLAVGEFRALLCAEIISVSGDQLARVALSLLVYQRTSSAALTALTYALTFAPALLGGALLSGLADRFPRRAVLVSADLVRAGFACLMAMPALPLPVLWCLVFGLAMAGAPFKAAQLALLPDVLPGERYQVGLSLRTVSTQIAQLLGFVVGGSVLLVVSVQAALAANALTFVVSALIVRAGIRARPRAAGLATGDGVRPASAFGVLAANRQVRVLVGLMWLAGLTMAPEGVAAPYASGLGGAALAVGLLLAADPLGSALGAWLSGRVRSPATRSRAVIPLAVLSGLVLVPCALRPGLIPSIVLWVGCGACSTASLIYSMALLKDAVPNARRGAIFGLASAGLQCSQGLVVLAAGLVGQYAGVYRAVGAVGVVTTALALLLGLQWRRARPQFAKAEQVGHGIGHGMSDARSEVTVAHSAPPFPDQTDSNKAGNA